MSALTTHSSGKRSAAFNEYFPEMSGDPCRRTISTASSFTLTTETSLIGVNPEFFPVNAWTFYATPGMSLAVRFTKDSSGVGNRKGNSPFDPNLQVKMTCNGRFLRYGLPFNYDYFGSIEASSRSLQMAGAR